MTTKISINLKASGIIALVIIGAGLLAVGAILPNEGVREAGGYLLGIGIFIIIIFAILSFVQKKNFFK